MSYKMRDLQPGQTMEFRGMLGNRTLNFSKGVGTSITQPPDLPLIVKKLVLIAGGTGISPMCQILRSCFFHSRDDIEITLLYGGNCPESLAYYDSLVEFTKIHSNFKMKCTVRKASSSEEDTMDIVGKSPRVIEVGSGIYKIGIIDKPFLEEHMPGPR